MKVLVGVVAIMLMALPGMAFAGAIIHVQLWDKGADSVVLDDAHMAMMGKMDMGMASKGMMGVKVDKASIRAGSVTFEVKNVSKTIIHEMILSPVAAGVVELPYLADENRVDEEKAGHLGEVSELDPGKSGALTVDLTPGIYILYCNIPAHFVDGMWTEITVTP